MIYKYTQERVKNLTETKNQNENKKSSSLLRFIPVRHYISFKYIISILFI